MGILGMKTKIIYISGNELFDMSDIRAAFDEVRNALSLDSDTVLFGVPVDNDDALADTQPVKTIVTPIVEPIVEPVADVTEEIETKPAEKPAKRTHRTKVVPISENITTPEPETKSEPEPAVIPILSVLGTKPEEADAEESPEENSITDDIEIENATPIEEEPVEVVIDSEQVIITDTPADDLPDESHEKTLEELLDSMTPLGEDSEKPQEPIVAPNIDEVTVPSKEKPSDDTDMTLEKLANEFVANQDKLATPTKPANRGKIGKLKNILPFKKAKHDDSGLMGDLFGWAGVAANDEDFTITGFFTNAASKK